MKRIISIILMAIILSNLSGCSSYEKTTLPLASITDKINIDGRYEQKDNSITFDWSGSEIEFKADVRGMVSANITAAPGVYDMSCDGKMGLCEFAVFVDGVRVKDNIQVDNTTADIILAENLEEGEHTFRLARSTNVYEAIVDLNSITLEGELLEMPKSKVLIEYLGDSYTTGYSITSSRDDTYDHTFDDATFAYAYTSAKILGADHILSAFSGAGFAYGYTEFNIPEVYTASNWFRDKKKKFEPERVPDLLVMNLGTNDVAKIGFDDLQDEFRAGVAKLYQETIDLYGKMIPIAICTDTSHENNDSSITAAFDEYFPDAEYKLVYLTKNTDGGNWHPSIAGGAKQGNELADALLEWKPDLFDSSTETE